LLLFFDPANDLVPVEDQSAVGLETEVREPSGDEGLSYGPRRAADEARDFGDIERNSKRRKGPISARGPGASAATTAPDSRTIEPGCPANA